MFKTVVYLSLCSILLLSVTCRKEKKALPENHFSIAFYNIDNLYDAVDDTDHNDNEFTPAGKYAWTQARYKAKLENMAKVVTQLADGHSPDILGVCELENRKALEALLEEKGLKGKYGIAHFDSPDERGVDVALAYDKHKFKLLHSEKISVLLSKDLKDKTRDQLCATLLLNASKDTFYVYVCHFPSRKEGKKESEQNRVDAAKACSTYVSQHFDLKKEKVIIMGDFNDEPWDKSIKSILGAKNIEKNDTAVLQNLMWGFKAQGRGSYKFKGSMNTLDQIIVSKALNDSTGMDYISESIDIFDADWLTQKGKYAGYPLRTFGGTKWLNGYSDHYPIYMYLKW
ncbi:MAG: endonuclease/exonuclease/phosphatase family protein [Bacteroidota bacterium]